MRHSIIRFRPSLVQEQRIISLVVDWVASRVNHKIDIEPRLVRMLTQDCCFVTETFDVKFRALHELVRNSIVYTSDTQQLAFDRAALHHFLCRVIGTQNVYKREPAHNRRRTYFDRCIQRATTIIVPVNFTTPTPTSHNLEDQVFNLFVTTRPELVAAFVNENKQQFIQFCLTK